MEVTHKVNNRKNKTCGFIIDNTKYMEYYSVLNNADILDNIVVAGNRIEPLGGSVKRYTQP